jgi:23S rRNA (adenine2503-C2)-methyltransferase
MSRFDATADEMAELLSGEPGYRLGQLWEGLYRSLCEPEELTALPRALRERLSAEPLLARAWRIAAESSGDGGSTVKWLLEATKDGARVETVLMSYPDRTTVCVSSQAGCAMGCSFCATGQLGFGRQLSSGEIVEQVVLAARRTRQERLGRLSNVVLMGMGEPLANYANVMKALHCLNKEVGIGARSMTVSTVGMVPGIRRLAGERLQVNLGVSLHAANDELRDRLVPINRRYDLASLMAACRQYCDLTRRRVSFEWALIAGVNDRTSDAVELAGLAGPLAAHVNLIPLNPTPGYAVPGSSPARVSGFAAELRRLGVNATVRSTRGRDLEAACGQLAAGMAVGGLAERGIGSTRRGSRARVAAGVERA